MKAEDTDLQILMLQLAAQTASETFLSSGPALPAGWFTLTKFESKPNKPTTSIYGLVAKGPLNDSYDMGIVVSLGIPWTIFNNRNRVGIPKPGEDRIKLAKEIIGLAPPDQDVAIVFGRCYPGARAAIWDSLSYIDPDDRNLPVYVTAIGLGAPIAQICSVDLRKGNTGPADGQKAPENNGPCYVFSAPNFANTGLKTYINNLIRDKKAPTQYVIHAASESLVADFFPTEPNDSNNTLVGEKIIMEKIYLPQYDVPWWERSDTYYTQSLGGEPPLQNKIPLSFSNLPQDFSQQMAFTAAQTVASAYQLAQHPDGSTKIDNTQFSLAKKISIGNSVYAVIYTSLDTVIASIRGSITFLEYYGYNCLSTDAQPAFAPRTATVHEGALKLYNAVADEKTKKTFAQTLNEALKELAKNKKVIMAGHDIGAAVAGLATADYAVSNPGFTVDALYAFGSTLFAGMAFADFFNEKVGTKSYQVYRTNDKLMNAIKQAGFYAINTTITMAGQLAIEEPTYHSIANYCNLLNPQAKFFIEE